MTKAKPKVLMLHTGGTLSQKKAKGILKPSNDPYLHKVKNIL